MFRINKRKPKRNVNLNVFGTLSLAISVNPISMTFFFRSLRLMTLLKLPHCKSILASETKVREFTEGNRAGT